MIIKSLNILFIDDVKIYTDLLTEHLDSLKINYKIHYTESVDQGLSLMNEKLNTDQQINLVISDFNMPEKNGLDLTKTIRSSKDFSDIPLIIYTAEADKECILDCINAGADYYLYKPWEVESFIDAVDRAFKAHNIRYLYE